MRQKFIKKINLIVEYGLYLLAFILPLQTRLIIKAGEINGGYWEYGTISLYGTDIVLLLLLLLFIVHKFPIKSQIQNQKSKIGIYWWLIGGLELFVFISIFFAADKLVAGVDYLRFLLGIGLFWLIVSVEYDRIKLIYGILTGVFLQAVLGSWQFLTQGSFASKWLGLAAHNAGDLGASVVETLSGERWLRAYGGLDHPNVLGGLLVVGILLAIYLVLKDNNAPRSLSAGQAVQAGKYGETEMLINPPTPLCGRGVICFLLFTFVMALFFTFSRGAWAGVLVGILTMLGLAVIKKELLTQKKLLKIILASGVLIFILFNFYSDLVLTRLSQDTRLEIKSNTERMEAVDTALTVIKKHWLFGTGIGNYTLVVHNEINDKLASFAYQPVHNTYLLILAEVGIIGAILFLALLFYLIISNFSVKGGSPPAVPSHWRAGAASGGQFSPRPELGTKAIGNKDSNSSKRMVDREFYSLPIIFSFLVMMTVDHWFWSLHFGVLFFWLVLGLIVTPRELPE